MTTTDTRPLRRAELNVLRKLALANRPLDSRQLPDDNGHCDGTHRYASGSTLIRMRDAGLIQYVPGGIVAVSGHVITDAGRAVLGRSIRATEG